MLAVLALLAAKPSAHAQQNIFEIDRLSYVAGHVTIEFTDSRLLADPNLAHALDYSEALGESASWTYIYTLGTTFSSLGSDRRMVTLPASNTNGFYRLGLDTDRDGLSDGLEAAALGTNPNLPDSDGDGYSDLIELANNTLPADASSRPLRGVQPSVQFTAPTSQTLEGAGTILIPVEFNTLYSGQLYYSLSVMSTAANGVDFFAAQSGVLAVSGTKAVLPVDIRDDLEVEDIEAIVLELKDDAAGTYHTGAFSTHTVLVMDNDAHWSGLLESGVGQASFRVCVLRSNATVAALLVPSPKSTTNHLGGQLIPLPPAGQIGWPVTNLALTATQFTGESVPLPAGTSRLLGQASLTRQMRFSAFPPPPGETNVYYLSKTNSTLGALVIGGEYREVLASEEAAASSLQFTNPGFFILAREAPIMKPLPIPTTPAQR
jgi:hypothetical protein